MDTLRAEFPALRFSWVDVEDQADVVDPVDINDFPTLLITRDQQPIFFGVLRPQADALRRLHVLSAARRHEERHSDRLAPRH
jgi:hypothetical protein